jgi:hypothetical protein
MLIAEVSTLALRCSVFKPNYTQVRKSYLMNHYRLFTKKLQVTVNR